MTFQKLDVFSMDQDSLVLRGPVLLEPFLLFCSLLSSPDNENRSSLHNAVFENSKKLDSVQNNNDVREEFFVEFLINYFAFNVIFLEEPEPPSQI
jgi:hypothetical protein